MEQRTPFLFAIGSSVKFKDRDNNPPMIVVDHYGYTSKGVPMITVKRTDIGFQEACFSQDQLESVKSA